MPIESFRWSIKIRLGRKKDLKRRCPFDWYRCRAPLCFIIGTTDDFITPESTVEALKQDLFHFLRPSFEPRLVGNAVDESTMSVSRALPDLKHDAKSFRIQSARRCESNGWSRCGTNESIGLFVTKSNILPVFVLWSRIRVGSLFGGEDYKIRCTFDDIQKDANGVHAHWWIRSGQEWEGKVRVAGAER